MEKIDKLYQDLEEFDYVRIKIKDEGFDYCFRHYASFKEIDDEKFHQLRKAYIEIANELESYIKNKISSIQDEIDNIED